MSHSFPWFMSWFTCLFHPTLSSQWNSYRNDSQRSDFHPGLIIWKSLGKGCYNQTYFALIDLIDFQFFVLFLTSNVGAHLSSTLLLSSISGEGLSGLAPDPPTPIFVSPQVKSLPSLRNLPCQMKSLAWVNGVHLHTISSPQLKTEYPLGFLTGCAQLLVLTLMSW